MSMCGRNCRSTKPPVFMDVSFIKNKAKQKATPKLKPSWLFRLPEIHLLIKQAIKHVPFGRKLVEIVFTSCSEFHSN